MEFKNPASRHLMLALDVDSAGEALSIAEKLEGLVGAIKLGPRLNMRYGRELVEKMARYAPVFVDNKYLDIPSTMEAAVRATFEAGASFTTVHAWSGREALARLAQTEAELNKIRPFKILSVTILTSFAENTLPPGIESMPLARHVTALASLTLESGLRGLVCSPHEVASLRALSKEAFLVTPGVRLASDAAGDQKRIETPEAAIRQGASALVVGRPIVEAKDPVAATERILESIARPRMRRPKRGDSPKSGKSTDRRPSGRATAPRPGDPRRPPARASSPRDAARWVVGLHSCAETLRVFPRQVRELWLKEGWPSSASLAELEDVAHAAGVAVREKSAGQLDAIGTGHQGVALACSQTPEVDWSALESVETALVLILDGIEDPHNLGSILRTAWLAGAKAIFIPADRAVGLTPAVCKVASGGAEHVPVEAVANLGALMEKLKKHGFWLYGLAEAGTRRPWEFELGKKSAWVIGNEAGGIRKATERACDELVRLPQVTSGSSYNAAIACAMALAETCRQFGSPL